LPHRFAPDPMHRRFYPMRGQHAVRTAGQVILV
jgi:hypothetical protein